MKVPGGKGRSNTKLIEERIEVGVEARPSGLQEPAFFTWRGRRYEVRRIVSAWVDKGFAAGEVTRRWWRRRHRNYYRVQADDGQVYEIYLDRGGSKRDWYLARVLWPNAD